MNSLFSWLLLSLLLVAPATSALGLPVPLPRLPTSVSDTLVRPLQSTARQLRQLELRALVRQHRRELEADPSGAPVVRGEVVAVDPHPESLARALAAGFTVTRQTQLEALQLRVVVLSAPPRMRIHRALRLLRKIDPGGQYDYNHLYLGADAGPPTNTALAGVAALLPAADGAQLRVGLVDSGVDATHPALSKVEVTAWGCGGVGKPDSHGTAVASLLAGSPDGGTAGSALLAADIYCGLPTGGAVTELAQALGWLSRQRVAVINLSVVGPPNVLLEALVKSMQGRGHALVAAAGNDGPAALPLYPAAYPGVIGVTALDARDRPLPEAARGDHVDFAAPGAGLKVAAPGRAWQEVRGTSFASPLVARRAALLANRPAPALATTLVAQLTARTRDAGKRGRDALFGWGLIGLEERNTWSRRE